MNVLIIPEDFRKDQYILKPLFQRLFRTFGKPSARVVVCQDPLLGGIGEALKDVRLAEIVDRYAGMTDIFLLCVDRDGQPGRRLRLDQVEATFGAERSFFAEKAWEELETWLLAGLQLPANWNWLEVRAEVSVKEVYFHELARRRSISNRPGGGRKTLGEEASRRIDSIRQKCPEDFDALARRIAGVL